MPKEKNIESPEKLWELFLSYKNSVKNTPIIVKDWVGKDASTVYREKERPLTVDGFENWCADEEIINDLGDYFSNKDERYTQYATICSRIKRTVRQDQIEGGMAGIYNPSITQRLNGLVDKTEVNARIEQPLFPD